MGRRLVWIVTVAEALIFMLPLSLGWLFLVSLWVAPVYRHLTQSATLPAGTPWLALWLALSGVGLCALWELFLRHPTYTLGSIPRRVKAGLVLGFVAAIPLGAKGWPEALFVFGVPLALLLQFYFLIKQNGHGNP